MNFRGFKHFGSESVHMYQSLWMSKSRKFETNPFRFVVSKSYEMCFHRKPNWGAEITVQ